MGGMVKMKKSYIWLMVVSGILFIMFSIIFRLANIPTHNSWPAFIAIAIIFSPLWILMWKISKDIKHKTVFGFAIIRFFLFVWIFCGVVNALVVLL